MDLLASAPSPTKTGFAARADMQLGTTLDPALVVRETLSALGRRSTVLPGLLSKVLAFAPAMLPRMLRVRLMGSVGEGMTKYQRQT